MIEAKCTRCKGTFIPTGIDPEDLIHGEMWDENSTWICGGIGDVLGEWIVETAPPQITPEADAWMEAAATHGYKNPDCADPDCEFHHPEVREYKYEEAGNANNEG